MQVVLHAAPLAAAAAQEFATSPAAAQWMSAAAAWMGSAPSSGATPSQSLQSLATPCRALKPTPIPDRQGAANHWGEHEPATVAMRSGSGSVTGFQRKIPVR
jgi:hypothetical protein